MSAPQMLLDRPGVRPAPLPATGRVREREESDRTVRRQLRLLASRLRLERALGAGRAELLDCDPLRTRPDEVAAIVSARLGLPCEVTVPAAQADERLLDALARSEGAGPTIVALGRGGSSMRANRPSRGLRRPAGRLPRGAGRYAVAGFGAGPDRGVVVLAESGRALTDDDLRLLESAASFLAGALRARRRLGEALLRDAVHGTDAPESLRARAREVGIDLSRGAAICLLADRTSPLSVEEVGAVASRVAPGLAHHLASDAAGVLLLVPLVGGAERQSSVEAVSTGLQQLVEDLRAAGRPELTAACADSIDVEGLPRALEECLALLPGREPEVVGVAVRGAEGLGVVRLLLGRVPAAATDRFVAATLGAIEGEAESAKLIDTLDAFFAANGSVRATAAGLAIHENTVRHRFRRLAAATGLDVLGSTDDRLTARMALTLHRLSSNAPARKEPK
jgi:sugar diacid utilization regulator